MLQSNWLTILFVKKMSLFKFQLRLFQSQFFVKLLFLPV